MFLIKIDIKLAENKNIGPTQTLDALNMLTSAIFLNIRKCALKLKYCVLCATSPPPRFFMSYLRAGFAFLASQYVDKTIKTFPAHFKNNDNKLKTQNGGGGGGYASFGESV